MSTSLFPENIRVLSEYMVVIIILLFVLYEITGERLSFTRYTLTIIVVVGNWMFWGDPP